MSSGLARSAADEWNALVSTAVVGTDRRLPPDPTAGWDTWSGASDPAVAVLDRAAAVVIARRAGACPDPAPPMVLPISPIDDRPVCPPACAVRLVRLLAGDHDLLLPEWLQRCEQLGVQLPWVSLPTLVLRGRRQPELDHVVRRLAGGRAEWLADVVPELGVRRTPTALPTGTPTGPPIGPPDDAAAISALVQVLVDGQGTWAAAPQLRLLVVALDPVWLPALVVDLSHMPFVAAVERTRSELLRLTEFRVEMVREFQQAGQATGAHPGGTVTA